MNTLNKTKPVVRAVLSPKVNVWPHCVLFMCLVRTLENETTQELDHDSGSRQLGAVLLPGWAACLGASQL